MALEVAMSDEKLHRPIGGLLWPCVFKIKNGRRYVERASRYSKFMHDTSSRQSWQRRFVLATALSEAAERNDFMTIDLYSNAIDIDHL
ncbi:hypothetical protein GX48_05740 [Paracoccidioides brasiliensis]|nr:hypothetical protein GX48_05740 [Paracoccidioides brasiliensis]